MHNSPKRTLLQVENVGAHSTKKEEARRVALRFHCLVDGWHDCEELEPKPKAKLIFVKEKLEDERHRTEVCSSKQISLHEVRKEQ